MKTFFYCIISCFLLVELAVGQPQLNYFNAAVHHNSVYLSFELASGNTCNGVHIYRSADGINFDRIHTIQGVCGDVNFSVAYNWTDHSPLPNALNYYKIELSNIGFSSVLNVYYEFIGNSGYLLKRKIHEEKIEVLLSDAIDYMGEVMLFSSNGNFEKSIRFNDDRFELSTAELNKGVYFLIVKKKSGKSLILKFVNE